MAVTVTSYNLEEATKSGLTLVDFWAPWCGPCKMMEPVLENLEQKYGDQIHFGKLNVDHHAETAKEFKVMSIPALVLFKDGKAIEKVTGYYPKEKLEKYIEKKITENESK
ncbi:thioredoxin [Pediococcus claussenii]|uniref:Thioredoxin n=1 Tax=Pediococcus claussenii (strain ATCC BAA-344 / DSM 14800 / JCM 18046 / KCTC 3811 / LMG 21948 / P06) TaxID=701521 RepID=G8PF14_PEDCP|nr:thioredoxin [Pediococcus claussenii]AEV95693.1 thioredoxin [Pediococcus claussenii ATCC BAA-344]ANZ69204.1 thiol reductase thioredoxin [Pediococcus claussenii]